MNPEQHDKVMECARIMAYAVARNEGSNHLNAKVLSQRNAKHWISEAYDFLDYKPTHKDVRDAL